MTTLKGLDQWASRDFSKNSAAVVKFAEMRDRALARQKGVSANDLGAGSVSAGGGGDAKVAWADVLKMLKQSTAYYDHAFDERFILVENPADVSTARDFLKCATAPAPA